MPASQADNAANSHTTQYTDIHIPTETYTDRQTDRQTDNMLSMREAEMKTPAVQSI